MFKKLISIAVLVAVTLFINPNAQAAIADCASQGCFAVCTDAGPIELYFGATGAHAGTISSPNIGTGACRISAGEGYLVILRIDTIVRTYDVENETLYFLDIGMSTVHSTVFGGYAYVTSGGDDTVRKVPLDCSGSTTIATSGDGLSGITHDGSTVYVMNAFTADITTIVPPATTATTHDIGRVVGDMVGDVKYHAGNNVLYVTGLAGVYSVPLPLDGTSTLWQALPNRAGWFDLTSTHLGITSSDGNSAYLIPISSPSSYSTMGCQSCHFTALNSSTLYTIGGSSPDQGAKVWNMSGVQESYSPVTTVISGSAAYLAPTVAPPICGDNVKNGTDECDGTDFGTATCQTLGFDGGTLSCDGSCVIDTSGCFYNCGNGSIETGEECDGGNLNGQDCTDLGFDSGTLSCSGSCTFNTTACVMDTCGNGSIDGGEDCDGTDLNGQACTDLGFDSGTLSCSPTACTFDTTQCVMDTCGDGTIDDGEDCDSANLGGKTCQTQGFDGGTLSCTGSCTLNTTACTMETCGDGLIDNGEQCDDNNANAGDGCGGNCQIEEGYTCEGEPSNCSLIEETCNQDGLVTVLTSIDHPDLQGAALTQYQASSALPKGNTVTCETILGVEVIEVEVPAGHHENIRIVTSTSDVTWHLWNGATLIVPIEIPEDMVVVGGGSIGLHSGSDINVKYTTLGLGTLGTVWLTEYLSTHPTTDLPGRYLKILPVKDKINIYAYDDNGNSVILAASDVDEPIIVNLDALGDLSEIFQPTKKKPPEGCGSCSISGNGDPSLPIAFLIIFGLLMMIRRRKVSGSR